MLAVAFSPVTVSSPLVCSINASAKHNSYICNGRWDAGGASDVGLTVIQPEDGAGPGESPQELRQHVHGELPQRQLPQDDHGQRNRRVDVGPCGERSKGA